VWKPRDCGPPHGHPASSRLKLQTLSASCYKNTDNFMELFVFEKVSGRVFSGEFHVSSLFRSPPSGESGFFEVSVYSNKTRNESKSSLSIHSVYSPRAANSIFIPRYR
jgi:hypothetical protein